MKKIILDYLLAGVAIMLLFPHLTSAQEVKQLAPELELVSGIGLSYGQVASLTPQVVFLGDYKNGWAFGPGIGLRAGIVTIDNTITDKSRDTQEEFDLTLFYRLRYTRGQFFGAVDIGAAIGLCSNDEGQWSFGSSGNASSRCRTSGIIIEPQAGLRQNRFSLSIGALVYQSDYSLTTVYGDIMKSQQIENDWAVALNIHLAYLL